MVAGPRYRMLETIREYALEKLDEAGEVEAIRGAHARWFAELVDRAEPELRARRSARSGSSACRTTRTT